MDALHAALNRIRSDPSDPTAAILSSLIKTLDCGEQFDLNSLYQLNYKDFMLAVDLMRQWRLDSYRYERGWASNAVGAHSAPLEMPTWSHPGTASPGTARTRDLAYQEDRI